MRKLIVTVDYSSFALDDCAPAEAAAVISALSNARSVRYKSGGEYQYNDPHTVEFKYVDAALVTDKPVEAAAPAPAGAEGSPDDDIAF